MPPRLKKKTTNIAEIFELVRRAKTEEEKILILRTNNNDCLQAVIQGAYDPSIQWLLPEGIPNFRDLGIPIGLSETNLVRIYKRIFPRLVNSKEGYALNNGKRQKIFIQALEGLDKEEGEVLCQIKEKYIEGISPQLLRKAFPHLRFLEFAVAKETSTNESVKMDDKDSAIGDTPSDDAPEKPKRRRGRPKGSKNKKTVKKSISSNE